MAAPQPTAAFNLDGSTTSAYGGAPAQLLGNSSCFISSSNDTSFAGPSLSPSACLASVANAPSLTLGAGSLSACARFRGAKSGAPLLSKLQPKSAGFAVELSESGRGLGVSFADTLGTSVHEELGHTQRNLADGRWHHACVVLQRWGKSPQLVAYLDGHYAESLRLTDSRLARLGSVDSGTRLLLGRSSSSSADGPSTTAPTVDALREVAVWSRALLPEHVASLAKNGLPPPRHLRHHHLHNQLPLPHHHPRHFRSLPSGHGRLVRRATHQQHVLEGTASAVGPLPNSGWATPTTSALLALFVFCVALVAGGCVRTSSRQKRWLQALHIGGSSRTSSVERSPLVS